ncbi:MAG TPA: phospholipase D-like domain-containing protein [Vicinamibacterales bacterium]|nr:phospholipase D-like domain-containing protein [Vicinamibacterales bacterium]
MLFKPVRRAVKILLFLGVVVAVLLLLAQDQQTLTVRSGVSAEDPRHPAYLAALVGADLSRGNRYIVHTNGDQIFPAMLAAIRGAKRRISFESYIYKSGTAIASEFTAGFEDAARRGVTVNLVLDAVGAQSLSAEDLKRLRDAGCTVALFNSPTWYSLEELNYRTHRKILVVDGDVGFTGGAGVDDQWKGNARSKDEWRDTQVEIHGPLARLLEGGFYENFVETAGEITPVLDDFVPGKDEEGASFLVRSSPTGGSNDLKRLYLFAIASARRTVDITTPYFVPDESTLWSLEDAVRRGVRIRLLVEGDITDAMPVKYASRHFYDRLLADGIEIHEYEPTMMHTKALVVDGIWSMFGSANFDNRSLELNDELNVAVSSRDLASRLLQDMEQDLKVSHRLELTAWRNRSLLMKARERFWSAFGEVF